MMFSLLHAPGFALVKMLLLLALALAAASDLRTRRIPNLLTVPLALVFIIAHGVCGGPGYAVASLLAWLAWFCLGYLFYRTLAGREIGAGDIKLVMATAAGIGFMPAAYVTFVSLTLLVAWLFVRWIAQGTARANFSGLYAWLHATAIPNAEKAHFRPVGMVDQTPFAPFLLLGTLLCYWLQLRGVIMAAP